MIVGRLIPSRVTAVLLAGLLLAAVLTGCFTDGANISPSDTSSQKESHWVAYPDGFCKGVDVSSLIAMEQSGAKYYNAAGEPDDLLAILADSGVNAIRVRVWNDPYDAEGHGYGGGNCDVAKACQLGRRAAAQGMKLLVDFHYSDFWADPSRQLAPKAWQEMDITEKQTALYDFTVESLRAILRAGGDVDMVQIGNEINGGLAGETEDEAVAALLRVAYRAVRDTAAENGKAIAVAVHYTGIENTAATLWRADWLAQQEVDYDIFGVSYYPYWHGSLDNLAVLEQIGRKYGKRTMILETGYPYTLTDGDGFSNVIGSREQLASPGYPAVTEGQSAFLWHLMKMAVFCGADGVFYWEGAWIPVSDSASWEAYGCGWATRYAASYDESLTLTRSEGCGWDNQALFYASGHPLPALEIYA